MKNRDAAVHPVAGLIRSLGTQTPQPQTGIKINIDKDALHVQTHFPALPTERAGSSNAPATVSTVSARSWFLNALLGFKKNAWASS